jgi:hypothetical protein
MSDPHWLTDGYPEDADALDRAPAAELLGRFACAECAPNRDAADQLEAEVNRLNAQLARAHTLLRLLARLEPQPARRRDDGDDVQGLALIGWACALAELKTRIGIYFQGIGG